MPCSLDTYAGGSLQPACDDALDDGHGNSRAGGASQARSYLRQIPFSGPAKQGLTQVFVQARACTCRRLRSLKLRSALACPVPQVRQLHTCWPRLCTCIPVPDKLVVSRCLQTCSTGSLPPVARQAQESALKPPAGPFKGSQPVMLAQQVPCASPAPALRQTRHATPKRSRAPVRAVAAEHRKLASSLSSAQPSRPGSRSSGLAGTGS